MSEMAKRVGAAVRELMGRYSVGDFPDEAEIGRAAIEVMRNPSDVVIEGGIEGAFTISLTYGVGYFDYRELAEAVYGHAIDAALSEPPPDSA